MATDITAAAAQQVNLTDRFTVRRVQNALTGSRTVAATPSRPTPDTLALTLDSRRNIGISVTDAGTAVRRAIGAGEQIISQLQSLEAKLTTAIDNGLVSPVTELRIDESRVSRLNINVAAGRTLTAIDKLVSQAETAGVNLISSSQGQATIQTTEFGGRVTIQAQPLDVQGLSLNDLSALTQNDAIEARSQVRIAISVASARVGSLGSLSGSLEFRSGTAQSFLNFGNEAVFEGAVRGRLVNLQA